MGLNGAVTHTTGTNTYVVHFNQSVAGCNGWRRRPAGSVTTGTANPTNNDISVSTFDATGAAAERASAWPSSAEGLRKGRAPRAPSPTAPRRPGLTR